MSEHNPFEDDGGTWLSEQQSLERDHPIIAANISEFRDWLLSDPGLRWLFEQLRLHRFQQQRRKLRDLLGGLP